MPPAEAAPTPDDVVAIQIVDAARRYFLRFGYSRVSTDEIVRSIGRSKKTLYKHFETKEALLHAVLARIDGDAEREITELLASRSGDRLERLRRILTAVAVHLASTHQAILADLKTSVPDIADQAFRERRTSLAALLKPVLIDAASEGLIRKDLSPDQVLVLFFGCVEGMASPIDIAQHAQSPGALFTDLVSLLVDGLRKR